MLHQGGYPGHGYIVRNNGFQENSYSGICKRSALPVFNDRVFIIKTRGQHYAGHLNLAGGVFCRQCFDHAGCGPVAFLACSGYFGHAGGKGEH